MNLGVSAEQQELRSAVRRFLADRAPLARASTAMWARSSRVAP